MATKKTARAVRKAKKPSNKVVAKKVSKKVTNIKTTTKKAVQSKKTTTKRAPKNVKKSRSDADRGFMISTNRNSVAALRSASDWWSEIPVRDILKFVRERVITEPQRLVDSIQSRAYVISRRKGEAMEWLAFGLLAGATLLTAFTIVFVIIQLVR